MAMKLASFLAADKVVLGFSADSARAALEQLVVPLVKAEIVADAEQFIADMLRREAEITTVMDNGVALPHARSNAVRRLGLVVGIAAAPGIQYNPESPVRSRLFFCIAVPGYAPTAHIPLLQALAKFSRDPSRVEKLLLSKTPSVAARYLINFKS
jgi:mannitol/fructose-specific phosphotransferase system IIA component (Ntr-type)